MVRVALDAMGGDDGAAVAVEGAARLSLEDRPVQVLLVGEPDVLNTTLAQHRYDPAWIQVVPSGPAIPMDAKPRGVLDPEPRYSVNVAAQIVADGEADALVSAGQTGATILSASRAFQRLPGIRRAALAAVHPTERRHGPHRDPFALILDVGATLEASAQDLVGFAVMGAAYARVISDNERPRVALLSNGTEAGKGTPAIVQAHNLLQAVPGLDFYGNVEGLDIPKGTADVVICDGFLGNVVLKMLEGIGEVFTDLAKDAYARKFLWRMGLTMLSQGLQQLRNMTDWKQYGGAPLLGLDKVVIKAHGRSNARAVRNAIRVAAKAVEGDLAGQIRSGMESVQGLD